MKNYPLGNILFWLERVKMGKNQINKNLIHSGHTIGSSGRSFLLMTPHINVDEQHHVVYYTL